MRYINTCVLNEQIHETLTLTNVMETNKMARSNNNIKPNPRTQRVFDDLDKYRNFCKEYGYRFDEADLYSNRSYMWRQYTKLLSGKEVKDQWEQVLNPAKATR
jgi:hypothetical protein